MLGENLQHAALGREALVGGQDLGLPRACGDVEDIPEPVRRPLVGPEDAEVVWVLDADVAEESPEYTHCFARRLSRRRNVDCVLSKVRQDEISEQLAAVRVRIRAHAGVTLWGERGELGHEMPVLVEQ